MPDSALGTVSRDVGEAATHEHVVLTRDTLWDLVMQGRSNGKGNVTTVSIHAPTDRVAFVHIVFMCELCGKLLFEHRPEKTGLVCPS